MRAELHRLTFDQASAIRANYAGARLRPLGQCDVLVISYSGVYRPGREGCADARMMVALGQAGILAWAPEGIILDLRDLDYRGGEDLRDILQIGDHQLGDELLPSAFVVGPECEASIRGQFYWDDWSAWSFRDFASAWGYLECEMAENRVRYPGLLRPIHPDLRGAGEGG